MGVAGSSGLVKPFYLQMRCISRRHRFKESFFFIPPLVVFVTHDLLTLSHSPSLFLRKNEAIVYNLLAWTWLLPSQKRVLSLLFSALTTLYFHCSYDFCSLSLRDISNFNAFSLFFTIFWITYLHSFLNRSDSLFPPGYLLFTVRRTVSYRDADKSLARPTSRCILFDG